MHQIKMRYFKSSENIQKIEGGQDRSVSDNQSSSLTLNELAMEAKNNVHHNLFITIVWVQANFRVSYPNRYNESKM